MKKGIQKISKESTGAPADSIILAILRSGDSYGYDLIQKLKELTGEKTEWHAVQIYPILKRLENEGVIRSYWKIHEERYRKYYTLLEPGIEKLEINMRKWNLSEMLRKRIFGLE